MRISQKIRQKHELKPQKTRSKLEKIQKTPMFHVKQRLKRVKCVYILLFGRFCAFKEKLCRIDKLKMVARPILSQY